MCGMQMGIGFRRFGFEIMPRTENLIDEYADLSLWQGGRAVSVV